MSKVTIKDISEAPNLQILKDTFGISEKDTIVSYGDAIYAPDKQMTADLLQHELVHCERQNFHRESADRWWKKYIESDSFRESEEIFAFHEQYKYCCKVYMDKNKQNKILRALAAELISERYKLNISYSDAMAKIKTGNLL